MYKNFIIIAVLALLFSTASNLSLTSAQKATPRSEKIENTDTSDDYHRTVNEHLVTETLISLYDAKTEYLPDYGIGDFGTLENLHNAGLIEASLDPDEKYSHKENIHSK